jgi:hypothetical protein
MPWHDEAPWRAKRRKPAQTPEQRLADIERLCRYGDISIGDAIRAAYETGKHNRPETATTKERV